MIGLTISILSEDGKYPLLKDLFTILAFIVYLGSAINFSIFVVRTFDELSSPVEVLFF